MEKRKLTCGCSNGAYLEKGDMIGSKGETDAANVITSLHSKEDVLLLRSSKRLTRVTIKATIIIFLIINHMIVLRNARSYVGFLAQ
jgi:hypothetical protein